MTEKDERVPPNGDLPKDQPGNKFDIPEITRRDPYLIEKIPRKWKVGIGVVLAVGALVTLRSCVGGADKNNADPVAQSTTEPAQTAGKTTPQGRQAIPESEQFEGVLSQVKKTNPKLPIFYNIKRSSITDPKMESHLLGSRVSWNFNACVEPNNGAHPAGEGEAILVSSVDVPASTMFQPLKNPTSAEIEKFSKLRNEFLVNWGNSYPESLASENVLNKSVTTPMGSKIVGCNKAGEFAGIATLEDYNTIFSKSAEGSKKEADERNADNTGEVRLEFGDSVDISVPTVGLGFLILALGVTAAAVSAIKK